VADEIRIAVCAFQLEVPVVGFQPRIEQFRHGDAPVTQDQRAWRLLATVAGVALDANAEEAFIRQVRSPYDLQAQNRDLGCSSSISCHFVFSSSSWSTRPDSTRSCTFLGSGRRRGSLRSLGANSVPADRDRPAAYASGPSRGSARSGYREDDTEASRSATLTRFQSHTCSPSRL